METDGQQLELTEQEKFDYKQAQVVQAFRGCFGSHDGKITLAALKDEFYDNFPEPLNGEHAMQLLGGRGVIKTILDILETKEQADAG